MARIELAPEVLDDFDRFIEHLATYGIDDTSARIAQIMSAIDVLAHSPHVGRKAKGGKRELVIGRESRGCVALYRCVEELDTVFVLALRAQREAGYKRSSGPVR